MSWLYKTAARKQIDSGAEMKSANVTMHCSVRIDWLLIRMSKPAPSSQTAAGVLCKRIVSLSLFFSLSLFSSVLSEPTS